MPRGRRRVDHVEQRVAPVLQDLDRAHRAVVHIGDNRRVDRVERGERVVERIPDRPLRAEVSGAEPAVVVVAPGRPVGDAATLHALHDEARAADGARPLVDRQHRGNRRAGAAQGDDDPGLAARVEPVHDARVDAAL